MVFALASCAGTDDGADDTADDGASTVSGSMGPGVSTATTVPGVSAVDATAAEVSTGGANHVQSSTVPPLATMQTTEPLAGATVPATSTMTATTMISTGEATPAPADPRSPPRVEFPDDPDRQAVVDAAYAFFDTARAAQADPANEALRALLATTMTEPIASRLTRFLDQLVLDGIRIIANPNSPTYLEIFEPSVTQVDGSGLVDVCAVDSDIQVVVATGEIVNDNIVSGVQTLKLRWESGRWVVLDVEAVDRNEGVVGCG